MSRFSETRASPESRGATMRNVTGSRGLGLGIARKQGEELAAATSASEQTLMSEGSRNITGTVITVDAGKTA
jgi:hypothetical protein